MVETNINVPEHNIQAFMSALPVLLEEGKNYGGGIPYKWTYNQIVSDGPYVTLKTAIGAPDLDGHNIMVLSYWDNVGSATAWIDSSFHKKLNEHGIVVVRKYEQIVEPGEREGLHEDRMQRDYSFIEHIRG